MARAHPSELISADEIPESKPPMATRIIKNAHEYNPLVADTTAAKKPKWRSDAIDTVFPNDVNANPYKRSISN